MSIAVFLLVCARANPNLWRTSCKAYEHLQTQTVHSQAYASPDTVLTAVSLLMSWGLMIAQYCACQKELIKI